MIKNIFALFLLTFSAPAIAEEAAAYTCPNPSLIHCVPAISTYGSWVHNGGQMTGNTFAPNSQCANVLALPDGNKRLFCCYTKCGVFIRDVRAQRCQKMGLSRFSCN